MVMIGLTAPQVEVDMINRGARPAASRRRRPPVKPRRRGQVIKFTEIACAARMSTT